MLAMKIGGMLLALIVLDDDPNSPKLNKTRAGIRSFRLEGTWASDCSKASSRENQYIEFEISSIGYPTMYDNDEKAPEGWIIIDAKWISSLRLRIKIESLMGVDRTVTIDK